MDINLYTQEGTTKVMGASAGGAAIKMNLYVDAASGAHQPTRSCRVVATSACFIAFGASGVSALDAAVPTSASANEGIYIPPNVPCWFALGKKMHNVQARTAAGASTVYFGVGQGSH